jgi:hypothetical protein
MGMTNAVHLRRIFRVFGRVSEVWLKRAKTWDTERMKAAVAKVCRPKEEPLKMWTFRLPLPDFNEGEKQVKRLQALFSERIDNEQKLASRATVARFLIAMCKNATDQDILHEAGAK